MARGGEVNGVEIGLTPWARNYADEADTLAGQAELADELGFHSFWLPESHFGERAACPAPLLLLAAAAARTRSLKLGTTSYLLPIRNAIQIAEEVAVLDRLSSGRVILGVGRGFSPAMFQVFDVPSSEKRERFEASLTAMIAAWRGDDIPTGAESPPVQLAPRPVQKPHPPIWVAAFGPKAMAQAGGLGLPYLASPMERFEVLEANYARHREFLPSDDCEGARVVPLMRTVFVTEHASLAERVRAALESEAARMAKSPSSVIRRAVGESTDDWAIIGNASEVRAGIERYRQALGMTHLIARTMVPAAEPAEIEASVRAIAAL